MSTARIELPPKLLPVFSGTADYRGAYGGRGSAKTRSFALMSAVFGYTFGKAGRSGMILGCREYMNSLDDSSLEEIKAGIASLPWLADYYEVGEKYIRSKDGRIKYGFAGLRHNIDSVKGKNRVLIAWADEAEPVSAMAWEKLDATVREDQSELWVTWNPENPDSATKRLFQDNPPPNSKIIELNWRDNPWFPERLDRLRLRQLELDPERYQWIWEGQCLVATDALIFANKFAVEDFQAGDDWDGPYQGLDFGFANDPTVAVKCWLHERKLFVEYEAGKTHLELDDTSAYLKSIIPGIERYAMRGDCSRPESISYLRRNGFTQLSACRKWPGSVKDGIQHMRSYDKIVIHPRCVETAREFRLYSYKIDRSTGIIQSDVVDANNHYIDAIRYALEPVIGSTLEQGREKQVSDDVETDAWGRPLSEAGSWKLN